MHATDSISLGNAITLSKSVKYKNLAFKMYAFINWMLIEILQCNSTVTVLVTLPFNGV